MHLNKFGIKCKKKIIQKNEKDVFGSNKFFAQLINLSESRTSAIISKLVEKEHLRIHLHRDCYTGRVIRRYLFPGRIYDDKEEEYASPF